MPTKLLGKPPIIFIGFADPGLDSRIAVLAPGALDLACSLMRSGYIDVTIARCCDRPRRGEADVVIVPEAGSAASLDTAVICGCCMLASFGAIAIRLRSGSPGSLLRHARGVLTLHGFTGIRVRKARGGTMVRAELPLCGQRLCA